MAKRASKTSKSLSSPNSLSSEGPAPTPNNKMVLRVRSASHNSKRDDWESEEDEKEMVPSSRKRSKSGFKRKSTSAQKKIDAKKPKKPPTAFFYFLEDFRKGFQDEHPEVKSMRDIGKACGEKWKSMTYEEKEKYYDIATEKRAEFDTAMAEYIRRKESGDDAEVKDSESEFDGE